MTVMVRTERDFAPLAEFRCLWCGESAVHWVETESYGYGTPLCDLCSSINEQLYDLRLTVRRAEAILRESTLPQKGQKVRHRAAGWRGIGTVRAVFGRLVEVEWVHGYTLHHSDEDLSVHDTRMETYTPRVVEYVRKWVR